jgi:hypothetical protein
MKASILTGLLLLTGCLTVDREGFPCSANGQCPSGYTCSPQGCRTHLLEADASVDGATNMMVTKWDAEAPRAAPDLAPDSPPLPDVNVPRALEPLGESCGSDDQCVSGACAKHEKRCCNQPCDGVCEYCDDRGQCQYQKSGDPLRPGHGTCVGLGTAPCGGYCNGQSSGCFYPSVECGTNECQCSNEGTVEGACTQTSVTKCEQGMCPTKRTSCNGLTCNQDRTACRTSCTSGTNEGCLAFLTCRQSTVLCNYGSSCDTCTR